MLIAFALALTLQDDKFQSLIERLGSEDIEIRERATTELATAGERAIPALFQEQASTDSEVRARIANLLRRSACARPPCSLEISCDEPKEGANTGSRIVVHVRNAGKGPALIYMPGLRVAGLATMNEVPDRFEWLEPNGCLHVELEGRRVFKDLTLTPLYFEPRDEFASEPSTMIFQMQNANPEAIAKGLHDLFKPESPSASPTFGIAVDLRTRSIVVRGSKEELEVVKKIVSELDRDQTEAASTYVATFRCGRPAAELAKDLERLLRGVNSRTP